MSRKTVRHAVAVFGTALFCCLPVFGDLVFPSKLSLVEVEPGRFRVELTLAIVQGRVLKAEPLLPEILKLVGEPEIRAGIGTVTRLWEATGNAGELPGSFIVLAGLTGTAQEVRFSCQTLDGRLHEAVLTSTRPFYVIPEPPRRSELVSDSMLRGLRVAFFLVGFWLGIGALVVSGATRGPVLLFLGSWAVGVAVGGLWERLPGLGLATCIGECLAAGYAFRWSVSSRRVGWSAALVAGLGVGLLAGGAGILKPEAAGFSLDEERLAAFGQWLGALLGATWILAILALELSPGSGRGTDGGNSGFSRVRGVTATFSAGWMFYQGAGFLLRYGPVSASGIAWAWSWVWIAVFSPFIDDWVMGKIRIPLLTLLLLGGGLLAVLPRGNRSPSRQAGWLGLALVVLAVLCLPWGAVRLSLPGFAASAPSASRARHILGPLLSQVYLALNVEDEHEAYDRLAERVSGDLITDLYLDSRRRLVAGTQGSALVEVRGVTVGEVKDPVGTVGSGHGAVYPCSWTVTARVVHWQHTHERRNLYRGRLTLNVEDDRWKLGGVDLQSEERQVVPGSFTSR